MGRILFVTGGSGGIGKSTTARVVSQALSWTGDGRTRVVLVDANLGQQTQRAYHGIDDEHGLERVRVDHDVMHALITPRPRDPSGRRYAILPGPIDAHPADIPRLLDLLGRALGDLKRRVDWVVVDLDKTDPVILADRETVAGGVMLPWVDGGGAGILYKLESQRGKVEDGLETLEALNRPRSTGVLGVVPIGAPDPPVEAWERRIGGMGRLVGVERWSERTGGMLTDGLVGFRPDAQPDWLDDVLAWCGVRIDETVAAPERKGVLSWFLRRR